MFSPPTDCDRAIEDSFRSAEISKIAKRESWRKEVYRPPYYLHKWWGRRLGTVFRAILIGACAPDSEDILDLFYQPVRFPETVVYDPMMGSGVTVGEATKVGAKTIGRDINPVAVQTARSAVGDFDRAEVVDTYDKIRTEISEELRSWYKTEINGETVDVLYYFWVKIASCPNCDSEVELFKNRIFSKHAYPNKNPEAKAVCPGCGGIDDVLVSDTEANCKHCGIDYNPQQGPARRTKATCPNCNNDFRIIDAVQAQKGPPNHRMYAKMILNKSGEKEYHKITSQDRELYAKAGRELSTADLPIPEVKIEPGHNTDQILNYNYEYWHQLFNDRQLLVLGKLARRISQVRNEKIRELFTTFFSGVLEFNSMLCSFKGEGTGAVRHTFSHHVLKPEKTPLEANPWGTPKSSGAFSTLFDTRLLRALDYKEDPFELALNSDGESEKIYDINNHLNENIVESFDEFAKNEGDIYLSVGDSSDTDIKTNSVDVVVTDPPFFDNVHYSELADFFYVWQRGIKNKFSSNTTRSDAEIQQTDAELFGDNLSNVFSECHRVLKKDGLLVFTYHHSRSEGWYSVLRALRESNFYIKKVHPVKSEMSVGVPKSQAENPTNLDMIFVCGSISDIELTDVSKTEWIDDATERAEELVTRFNEEEIELSLNDIMAMTVANSLIDYSTVSDISQGIKQLRDSRKDIEKRVERLNTTEDI